MLMLASGASWPGGIGLGCVCVTPVEWRSVQPDASACLGSVCLEPSRVKIISTTDWQGAWACPTQWAGAALPTSLPRTQPRPALLGALRLFPTRMGYWEIAENRVACTCPCLHSSMPGVALVSPHTPKCPQPGAPSILIPEAWLPLVLLGACPLLLHPCAECALGAGWRWSTRENMLEVLPRLPLGSFSPTGTASLLWGHGGRQ